MKKLVIKDKKKVIQHLTEQEIGDKIKVLCMGSNYFEPYLEDLEEVPISAIPFLINEESIFFVEMYESKEEA